MEYDSESEDSPRVILNVNGDFTIHNSNPPIFFKLHEFEAVRPQIVHPRTGQLVPFEGVLATRPVPSPSAVARAHQVMGDGQEGCVWMATKFQPPSDSSNIELGPDEVFRLRKINATTGMQNRFCIRRRFVPAFSSLKTMCIFTDGACLGNGSDAVVPRGGAGFVFKDGTAGQVGFPLENRGVDGQTYAHTNSRAELRAVLAALTYRVWWGEGWERIVIVTDSEYVANHATAWIRNWANRGWRLASGKLVSNRDLWQKLSSVMGTFAEGGCEISFWSVPRRFNTVADRVAKAAARGGGGDDGYTVLEAVAV